METPQRKQATALEEINISFDNKQLCASAAGRGPVIVLLHSLLADQTSFYPILAPLSRTHRVVLLSLPGFGASGVIRGDLDVIADHVAAALRKLDLGPRPIFLGNGYGAFMAATLAIRHPGIAAKLVLVGCGVAFSELGRAAFRQMSLAAREHGLQAVADTAMRRLFSPEFQANHPDLIAERKEHFLSTDLDTFHDACSALATLDLRAGLPRIEVPVMILAGEHDEATPPAMASEMVDALPDAHLCLLKGCAHVPQLQEPVAFLSAIREFIDQP